MQKTNDGGYIIAGKAFSNDGDVSGNHVGYDYWIVKLNADCALEWQKTLGGTDNDFAFSIHQTLDGGYAVARYTYSNDGNVTGNHGNTDAWIVKLDASGALQWEKTLGGTSYDYAFSMNQPLMADIS